MSANLAVSAGKTSFPARVVAASNPWFTSLDEGAARSAGALSTGSVQNFAQEREIYGEGDQARFLFKVVSGVVRTCKFLSDGRRQIDSFHVAGEFFGLEFGETYSLSAEAVSDCTVIAYRRPGPESLAANDGALSGMLLSHTMRSLARAQEHSLLLGRRSAIEKVATFLIEWAEQSPGGDVAILAMTRQDIGDYLGLTLETVSRTLSQLERDGLIDLPTSRQIRLKDTEALRELNA
jgi:CRP/FNR family nitrogen fixation transcriptional regulator